ncbi:hypothetical protein [Micromonospora sp. NPDC126480]|uniref:hypothetical protein n=1 Tax=Micromonospora sp. NPDC126480 TaxID=3155312 RepID=UPI00331FAC36
MTSSGVDGGWLRALPAESGPVLARGGQVVHGPRRLSDLVHRRPPGVTGHQWTTSLRETFDLVVCAADTGYPTVAVEIGPPPPAGSSAQRVERMKDAVSAAVGLPVLRIGSPTLRAADHGAAILAYVIDARGYAERWAGEPGVTGFREILGRLPDGRTGAVNDLGALTRTAAVEAYVSRRLADPIVRGLHVQWSGGPAEGWSWVAIRPDALLVERVTVTEHRFASGVDPARLAEDLATLAVGERLRAQDDGTPALTAPDQLRAEIRGLAARRDELAGGFAFDHLCVD